jgi:predicted enzyme related to lactoylglutathione lyase
MELTTARIVVRDIVAAKQFYEKALGLRLKADGSPDGYCVFMSGSMQLVVESVADDAPEEDRALVGRFTGLSFAVEDAAQTHEQLQAAGVHFTGLPEKQFWGGILATFQDPSGNQLQIAQQPSTSG